LRGASKKEQRQYEHIKKSAQRSGRYGKRAKEVAARTVMKQHRKKGLIKHRALQSPGGSNSGFIFDSMLKPIGP